MKRLKLFFSIVVSVAIVFTTLPNMLRGQAQSAQITKTVTLLDLSEFNVGDKLSKASGASLPNGMEWGKNDDYSDGIREIVADPVDSSKKALKLNFNKKVAENSKRMLSSVENYEFSLEIPEAYRPYIETVKMEFDNQSVASDGSWGNKNLNYLLSFTNGTDYAKDVDQTTRVQDIGVQTSSKEVTDCYKVGDWYYTNAYDSTSGLAKWTQADKADIKKVLIAVTVPSRADTDDYMLIKSVSIVVKGTSEELSKAEESSSKVKKTINLLDLTGFNVGDKLSKDSDAKLPNGMYWGKYDDYSDGIREIAADPDDSSKKVLKLNFNKQVEESDTYHRQLCQDKVENYELSFRIPKSYRKYVKSVKVELDNQSVAGNQWVWNNKNLNYLLSFTDGDSYFAKDSQGATERVLGLGAFGVEKEITDFYKIGDWYYKYGYDNAPHDPVKWSDADKESIRKVLLAVTVPAGAATDTYVLVKSVSIVVEGTPEELAEAEKHASEIDAEDLSEWDRLPELGKDEATRRFAITDTNFWLGQYNEGGEKSAINQFVNLEKTDSKYKYFQRYSEFTMANAEKYYSANPNDNSSVLFYWLSNGATDISSYIKTGTMRFWIKVPREMKFKVSLMTPQYQHMFVEFTAKPTTENDGFYEVRIPLLDFWKKYESSGDRWDYSQILEIAVKPSELSEESFIKQDESVAISSFELWSKEPAEPEEPDLNRYFTCGNGNGIKVRDKNAVLSYTSVVSAFRNIDEMSYAEKTLSLNYYDGKLIDFYNINIMNDTDNYGKIFDAYDDVELMIPISDKLDVDGIKAAIIKDGILTELDMKTEDGYYVIKGMSFGDIVFYTGNRKTAAFGKPLQNGNGGTSFTDSFEGSDNGLDVTLPSTSDTSFPVTVAVVVNLLAGYLLIISKKCLMKGKTENE